jgi:hypothetical protein
MTYNGTELRDYCDVINERNDVLKVNALMKLNDCAQM